MKIRGILEAKGTFVATVPATHSVADLLATLALHGVGAVPVTGDDGSIEGVASERDVVLAIHREGPRVLQRPVAVITTPLVAICNRDSTVEELAIAMTENRVRHIPVLDSDGTLAGIVSIGDIVKARIDQLEYERKHLIDYITS